jgi:hypothetical protein
MRSICFIGACLGLISATLPTLYAAQSEDREEASYWGSHSVIYAEIAAVARPGGDDKSWTIKLRPQLRLTGEVDPGKQPEISVKADLSQLGAGFKLPAAGTKVLAVVVRSGDSYSLLPTRIQFMPGDHAPICEVKDFDDPKVDATLKAVQELRKKHEIPR